LFPIAVFGCLKQLNNWDAQAPPSISDTRLVQICPRAKLLKEFSWPTPPFNNGGPNGIGYLMYRWKQGAAQVSEVTKDGVVE